MDFNYIRWTHLVNNSCPCLFKSWDGRPISFYFHIDSNEVKKKFEDLVLRNGGHVVKNYANITPVTAFMVDDKSERKIYDRVSFKSSYIIDCVNFQYLKHINDYIHNCVPKFKNIDYMDVFFLRKTTVSENSVNGMNEEEAEHSCSGGNKIPKVMIRTVNELRKKSLKKANNTLRASGCDDCGNNSDHNSYNPGRVNVQQNYVSKNQFVGDKQKKLQGKHCPTCTCHSEINSKKFKHRRKEDPGCSFENSPTKHRLPSSSSSDSDSSDDIQQNISDSSESDVNERNISNDRRKNTIAPSCSHISNRNKLVLSDVEEDVESPSSSEYIRNREQCILSSEEDDVGPPTQSMKKMPDKHTRKMFSRKEQEAMLNYIIKKDALHAVKGVNIWKRMEHCNVCPQRTWMSMHNHFRRSLINDLEKFPFLTKDQIRALRN